MPRHRNRRGEQEHRAAPQGRCDRWWSHRRPRSLQDHLGL